VTRLSDRAAAAEDLPSVIEDLQAAVNRLVERPLPEPDRQAMAAHQRHMEERLERQAAEMRGALAKITERLPDADRDAVAEHQRNIETNLARLVEESTRDREALADELRGELRLLARTLALARTPGQPFVAAAPANRPGED
jgi:hypothetical protein